MLVRGAWGSVGGPQLLIASDQKPWRGRALDGASVQLRDLAITVGQGRAGRHLMIPTTLDIAAGAVTCILGPSGSGKSTLLKVLAALLPPTSGTAIVAGEDVSQLSPREALRFRRESVGLVYQQYNLFDTLSAEENVALPLELKGVPRSAAMSQARERLAMMGLGEVARDRPATLSGGEQQRVAIARAMVAQTPVLLADEPTGALDSVAARQVVDTIVSSAQQGACCVVVTHNDRVAAASDHVLQLRHRTLEP